jgi:hypothetical protein
MGAVPCNNSEARHRSKMERMTPKLQGRDADRIVRRAEFLCGSSVANGATGAAIPRVTASILDRALNAGDFGSMRSPCIGWIRGCISSQRG